MAAGTRRWGGRQKAGRRGNAILPYLGAPGSFKRLLGGIAGAVIVGPRETFGSNHSRRDSAWSLNRRGSTGASRGSSGTEPRMMVATRLAAASNDVLPSR